MSPPADPEARAIAALIARYPLAWVVSRGFNASTLPLLAEPDADGRIVSLLGHCSRANPLVADFTGDSAGLVQFTGPAGYISPRYVSNRDWAPTWNFATLHIEVEVEFIPDETALAVERLLDHMEGPLPQRWSSAELGERKARLLSRIVAFRAHVRAIRPQFKLGQDESHQTFREIVENLPDQDLSAWMTAFAEGRAP